MTRYTQTHDTIFIEFIYTICYSRVIIRVFRRREREEMAENYKAEILPQSLCLIQETKTFPNERSMCLESYARRPISVIVTHLKL